MKYAMNKILTTLILSIFCVLSLVCICAIGEQGQIYTSIVSKEKVVYITPSGQCYHYSKSCAGKNAIATTLDKCKGKRPCKKCVK